VISIIIKNKNSADAEMGDRLATVDIGLKVGVLCPFLWGGEAGFSCDTMSPGPRPTFVSSGILIHPAVWPQQTWAKYWELCPFLGRAGSPSNNVAWAEAYLHTKWHLDPFNCLATIHQRHKQSGQTTVR